MIDKAVRLAGSLKFAISLMSLITLVMMVGTFTESYFGTAFAKFYIYRSSWFLVLLTLLFINILTAALLRLPYRFRLLGFYTSHLGLLLLLTGSFITLGYGVDGSIELWPLKPTRTVQVDTYTLHIIAPHGEHRSESLGPSLVDWIRHQLTQADQVRIQKYLPFAVRREMLVATEPSAARTNGFEFLLASPFFKQSGMLLAPGPENKDQIFFGPLTLVHLGKLKTLPTRTPVFEVKSKLIVSHFDEADQLHFYVYEKGALRPLPLTDQTLALPWMNMTLTILHAVPHGQFISDYAATYPNQTENYAVAVKATLGEHSVWVGSDQNSPQALVTPQGSYYLLVRRDQIALPYHLRLEQFRMETQPGSNEPASFESSVTLSDESPTEAVKIFMNHPLKKDRFTFYQASYFSTDDGNFGSVLAVNRDPGRPVKYTACLLIVFGFVLHWLWCRKSPMTKP